MFVHFFCYCSAFCFRTEIHSAFIWPYFISFSQICDSNGLAIMCDCRHSNKFNRDSKLSDPFNDIGEFDSRSQLAASRAHCYETIPNGTLIINGKHQIIWIKS